MPFRLCKLRYKTTAILNSNPDGEKVYGYGVRRILLDSPAWIEEPVKLGDDFSIEQSTWTVIEISSQTLPDEPQSPKANYPFP